MKRCRIATITIMVMYIAAVNCFCPTAEAATIRLIQDEVGMYTSATAGGVTKETTYKGTSFGVNRYFNEELPSLVEVMGEWRPEYEEWTTYSDYINSGGAVAFANVGWSAGSEFRVLADTYTGADSRNRIYDERGIEYQSTSKIETKWLFNVNGDDASITFDRSDRNVPMELELYDVTAGALVAEFFYSGYVQGNFSLLDSHTYLLTSLVSGHNTDPPQGFFSSINGAAIIVPEPSFIALLFAGLLGLVGVSRRIRN